MANANLGEILQRAIEHHEAGRLAQAEALYREALACDPRCADALHLLGVAAGQAGRHELAAQLIRQALVLTPRRALFHANLGETYRGQERYEDAMTSLRQALALQPNFPAALISLGAVLAAQACNDEALACFRQALQLEPNNATTLQKLAEHLGQLRQFEEADACFQRALALQPNSAELHDGLGNVYKERGQNDLAIARYQQAIALRPDFTEAYNNLGNSLRAQNRMAEAIAVYRQAIALNPGIAEIHYNLGVALTEQNQLDEALACCQRALALKPNLADAHSALGVVFKERGQLDEALASCQRALTFKPDLTEAHINLGVIYKERGQLDEALSSYRRAIGFKNVSAAWHSNLILALHYRSGNDAVLIDSELQRWSHRHAQRLTVVPRHPNAPDPDRRLRIGYLSPDFRAHPVGRFLQPLFTHHSRESVEIFCYSNTHPSDHLTDWFRSSADGWRAISALSDQQAADLIREDRVDLLVDLGLHTARSRLPILAFKPAPVQATYLAYPGSSGLDTVDFRITDAYLDPLDHADPRGNERPARLHGTYWCYQPTAGAAVEAGPPPALTAGRITFGCFNNFCKATPEALAAWSRVLQAAPDARLRLHVRPGSHRSLVLDFFASQAVDPGRIDFLGFVPETEYFQAYRSIDIALDPFPFPGGTTTCDALWMGVPVISLAGSTPVSRGGLSLLSHVGLAELVALSVDAYVEKAISLAQDLGRLVAIRAGLRERVRLSPLMDGARFARDMENAYRAMWHWWCARQTAPPASSEY